MAKADGVIAPEEQTMLQRICEEHLEGIHSHAWRDVASSAIDLKTAATAIPISERQSTLELAYLLISACGDEQGFPINPAELYAFNALVNHFDLTEDQKECSITAAKQHLKTGLMSGPCCAASSARPLGYARTRTKASSNTTFCNDS